MLYAAYQTQSDMMAPVRAWASMALAAGGPPLLGENSTVRNLTAAYELISRAGLTHTRPPFGITSVHVGNREAEVGRAVRRMNRFGVVALHDTAPHHPESRIQASLDLPYLYMNTPRGLTLFQVR